MDIALRTIEGRRYLQQLHPCEAEIRPGAPAAILSLRAPSSSAGSQPNSASAPPSISTSARLRVTIRLGLASTKCGSSVGLASALYINCIAADFFCQRRRVGVVATTLIFLPGAIAAPGPASTATVSRIMLVISVILTC